MTAEPTAQPALEELLDLAVKTRQDIRRDDLHGAVLAARAAGWTWARTLVEVAQMLARGEEPRDLRTATTALPWQQRRHRRPLERTDDHA